MHHFSRLLYFDCLNYCLFVFVLFVCVDYAGSITRCIGYCVEGFMKLCCRYGAQNWWCQLVAWPTVLCRDSHLRHRSKVPCKGGHLHRCTLVVNIYFSTHVLYQLQLLFHPTNCIAVSFYCFFQANDTLPICSSKNFCTVHTGLKTITLTEDICITVFLCLQICSDVFQVLLDLIYFWVGVLDFMLYICDPFCVWTVQFLYRLLVWAKTNVETGDVTSSPSET